MYPVYATRSIKSAQNAASRSGLDNFCWISSATGYGGTGNWCWKLNTKFRSEDTFKFVLGSIGNHPIKYPYMWYCGVLLEVPVAVCTLYFCSLFRPLVLWGMYCPVAGSKHPFLCLKKTSTEPEREPALVIRNQKFSHIWAGHYCLDRILELLLGLLWEVKICEFKCYRISSLLDDEPVRQDWKILFRLIVVREKYCSGRTWTVISWGRWPASQPNTAEILRIRLDSNSP